MHPEIRDEFCRDLSTAQKAVRAGVVDKRAQAADKHWDRWVEFCHSVSVDPSFPHGDDPIPYLQVFATRYRDGRGAPRHKPVRAGTVSEALQSIGQAYRSVGAPDIRLDVHGSTDFRLERQIRSYKKEDPPSQRVKPVPIQVVMALVTAAYNQLAPVNEGFRTIADMICIAFFFLCCPGEHTYSKDNTPFKFQDVAIYIGNRIL